MENKKIVMELLMAEKLSSEYHQNLKATPFGLSSLAPNEGRGSNSYSHSGNIRARQQKTVHEVIASFWIVIGPVLKFLYFTHCSPTINEISHQYQLWYGFLLMSHRFDTKESYYLYFTVLIQLALSLSINLCLS
jgi:hypothetical protein